MLAIFWHSRTGASKAIAQAVLKGAGEPRARLIAASEAKPQHFFDSEGYLFACPENFGTVSGEMKEMFDRCYYPLLGKIEGRPYATIVSAGSDGHGATAQIDRIVTGWRLKRVVEAKIVNLLAQTPAEILAEKVILDADLQTCQEIGALMSEGIEQGIF